MGKEYSSDVVDVVPVVRSGCELVMIAGMRFPGLPNPGIRFAFMGDDMKDLLQAGAEAAESSRPRRLSRKRAGIVNPL